MSRSTFQQLSFIAKLAVLWLALLVLPFTERTLLGAKSYYFLYIGLGLVFVMYGLTIRSIFFLLQHTRREPVYVWIAFLLWSVRMRRQRGGKRVRGENPLEHDERLYWRHTSCRVRQAVQPFPARRAPTP
jgi:hypothetical protein